MKDKILKEINRQIRFTTGLKKPPETLSDYMRIHYIPPIAEHMILPRLDVLYHLKRKILSMKEK
jgi:hypothetical protein